MSLRPEYRISCTTVAKFCRRKITADTSLRLAKFFGVSDKYFLDLQNDIEIRNLKVSMAKDIADIRVYQAV